MRFAWTFVVFAYAQPNFDALVEPLSFLQNSSVAAGTKYAPVVYGDHVINKVLNNFGWDMAYRNYFVLSSAGMSTGMRATMWAYQLGCKARFCGGTKWFCT